MLKKAQHKFNSESELMEFLIKNAPSSSKSKMAIVAGHYMLMYDFETDGLVPMVYQDGTNKNVINHSKNMAGDFPLYTFEIGLQLVKLYKGRNVNSKIVLLINDHQFKGLSDNYATSGGKLRHRYYRSQYPLPNSYLDIMQNKNCNIDEVLLNNHNPNRSKTDILPKNSYFFSEQAIRNKFDQYTKTYLLNDPHFSVQIRKKGGYNLYFHPNNNQYSKCLTDDGRCGCGAEVIQFLLDINKIGFDNIIFFSPFECKEPVLAGAQAVCYLVRNKLDSSCMISVISNFGESPEVNIDNQISLNIIR